MTNDPSDADSHEALAQRVRQRDKTSNARDMKLRVWRQTTYIDVDADALGRRFGVRMRTFGTPGASYLWR